MKELVRQAVDKERRAMGNNETTSYCGWTGVDCPLSIYNNCTMRPRAEKLELLAEKDFDYEYETELDDLAIRLCDFEKYLESGFEQIHF